MANSSYMMLHKGCMAVVVCLTVYLVNAQEGVSSFKFDFGAGEVADGFLQVLPDDLYTSEKKYGFTLYLPKQNLVWRLQFLQIPPIHTCQYSKSKFNPFTDIDNCNQ